MSALVESESQFSDLKTKVRDVPVCIVIPPSSFLADERVFPFLGPLKVAAELERNGNPVEVLDLSGYSNCLDIVDNYAKRTDTRTFGVTATTPQLPAAISVIRQIKQVIPDSNVILGGTHATLTYTSAKVDKEDSQERRGTRNLRQLETFPDKLVVGDGEKAIYPAIDPDNKEKIIGTGQNTDLYFLQKGELEKYPFPARHLIDLDSYHYSIDGYRATSMIVQLGCPFGCRFCSGRNTNFLRTTRTREIDHAILEMKSIYETYGYPGFMFYDDELNVSPRALENLCDEVIKLQDELGVDFRLRGFVKAELFTREQAKKMYQAGFRVLLTGVESGSLEILDAIKKGTKPDTNQRCREYAGEAGLAFKALMSIGHPGESEQTVQDSIDWVLANKPEDVDWTIITPYPGADYFDRSVWDPQHKAWKYTTKLRFGPNRGKEVHLWNDELDYTQEADYYKGIPGEYQCHVFTETLNREELVELRDEAERLTRSKLGLSSIQRVDQLQFEHSMGQGLPLNILKSSVKSQAVLA